MFLNQLDRDEQEMFLSLSVHLAEANGEFASEERKMIEEYCKEMGIVFFDSNHIKPMDEVVATFKDKDTVIKRIVLMEALGLAYADGEYDDQEMSFVSDFATKIGLDEVEQIKQEELLKKYLDVMKEMVTAINL